MLEVFPEYLTQCKKSSQETGGCGSWKSEIGEGFGGSQQGLTEEVGWLAIALRGVTEKYVNCFVLISILCKFVLQL